MVPRLRPLQRLPPRRHLRNRRPMPPRSDAKADAPTYEKSGLPRRSRPRSARDKAGVVALLKEFGVTKGPELKPEQFAASARRSTPCWPAATGVNLTPIAKALTAAGIRGLRWCFAARSTTRVRRPTSPHAPTRTVTGCSRDRTRQTLPSGSKRWFACPGSPVLEAPIPNKSSTYSDDGTAIKPRRALCLTEHWRASKYVGQDIPVNSRHEEPRFVEFTDEMAELVQGYVDTVRKIGIGHRMLVETRVDFSEFVQIEDQFGTADCIIVDLEQGSSACTTKTGHTPVTVPGNTQAMFYALARCATSWTRTSPPRRPTRSTGRGARPNTIRIGIYQPKVFANGWRTGCARWRICGSSPRWRASKAASVRNAEAMHGKIPMEEWDRTFLNQNPNEEECAFCRAMPTRPSAQRKVIEVVGADFDVITDDDRGQRPVNAATPVRDPSTKMEAVGFVEDWCKAARDRNGGRSTAKSARFGLELGRQGPQVGGQGSRREAGARSSSGCARPTPGNMKFFPSDAVLKTS